MIAASQRGCAPLATQLYAPKGIFSNCSDATAEGQALNKQQALDKIEP